jgi:hypothetical protein
MSFSEKCLHLSCIPAMPLFSFGLIKLAGKIFKGPFNWPFFYCLASAGG